MILFAIVVRNFYINCPYLTLSNSTSLYCYKDVELDTKLNKNFIKEQV